MSSPLATSVCGVSLKNPVLAASGTYAYGVEFQGLVDLGAIGGIIVKGLSREPMDGNPPPRLFETEGGMLNSIGLQNIGVRAFVQQKLPALRTIGTAIIANVFGYSIDDYLEVVRVLDDAEGLAAYELNVSCPNTKHGGIFFSSDAAMLAEVVGAVRNIAQRPLIVKLSPNVARIEPLAEAAAERRRRCDLAGEHVHRAGHRRAHPPSAHRRGIRGSFRSRHQADRAAHGL